MCVYIVAPFLEKIIQKISNKKKIAVCLILVTLFCFDQVASNVKPRTGIGITQGIDNVDITW